MVGTVYVDDPADPRLAVFGLHDRGLSSRPQRRNDDGDGLFMAEGDLVVERALDAGCAPIAVLVDAARTPAVVSRLADDVPVYAGGDEIRRMVTKLGVPNDVIAVFRRPPRSSLAGLAARSTHLVLCEAIDNPANVGAIVRNASGLGWSGMVLDRTSADPLARRALRVSMGHALALPHARTPDVVAAVALLRAADFTIAALAPDGSDELGSVGPLDRVVLAVGAERAGLSDGLLAAADIRIRIPMAAGVDSLNVAAATAIACYVLGPRR